jgi:hypothetical protein
MVCQAVPDVRPGAGPAIHGSIYHVGVVVRDLDSAMDLYRLVLGVPAFHRIDTSYPARHRDWYGTIANRNAFGRSGGLIFELVEPGVPNGPAHEFLSSRGEGVFHIGYSTDDPAQRPAGVGPCFEVESSRMADGNCGIVYLDTIASLGYFVELVETSMAERIVAFVDDLAGPGRAG